jgi:hypothetical protein
MESMSVLPVRGPELTYHWRATNLSVDNLKGRWDDGSDTTDVRDSTGALWAVSRVHARVALFVRYCTVL